MKTTKRGYSNLGKCTYNNCEEHATAIHRNRRVCSMHYFLLRKISRVQFELKKQQEVQNG